MGFNCEICGEQFNRKPSEVLKGHARFCSYICFNKSRNTNCSKKIVSDCLECGISFSSYRTSKGPQKFCSKICSSNARTHYRISNDISKKKKIACIRCGKIVFRFNSQSRPQKYCSRKCYLSSPYYSEIQSSKMIARNLVGAKNPSWEGGKTDISEKIRNSTRYTQYRKSVFERDNFTCVKCGKRGGVLNAHHKLYLSDIIEIFGIKSMNDAIQCAMLWDVSNGQTVCRKCHTEIHFAEDGGFYDKKIRMPYSKIKTV